MSTPTGLLDQFAHLHDLARRLADAATTSAEYPEHLDDLPGYVIRTTEEQRVALYLLAQHIHKLGVGDPPETSSEVQD